MKKDIKKLSETKIEINFQVPKEEFKEYIDKILKDIQTDFEYPGFRKGQVPLEVVKKNVSENFILERAANECVKNSYLKVLKDEKMQVIGNPQVTVLKLSPGDDFEFRVSIEILPEINLPDYKKIASDFTRNKIEVTEKDVEDTIKWILKSRAKTVAKEVESRAEKGDYVEISVKNLDTQEESHDAFILGEGKLVGDMEKQIEGMKIGETKDIKVKFPSSHFRKDLAGKEVAFNVKVNGIFNLQIPNLTDDFVKTLGNFSNVNELKESIRSGIRKEKEIEESNRLRSEILNKIVEQSNFEIPQILIEREMQRIKESFQKNLERNKMSLEDYLKRFNKTKESLEKEMLSLAESTVKKYLVLLSIIKKENIKASEEEIQEEVQKILNQYNSIEEAKKDFDEQTLLSFAEDRVLQEKALKFLESLAKNS